MIKSNNSKKVHIKNIELSKIKTKNVNDKKCIIHLKNKIAKSNQKDFKHANLVEQPKIFHYLCGLSVEQFKIIFNCLPPTHIYFHTQNVMLVHRFAGLLMLQRNFYLFSQFVDMD